MYGFPVNLQDSSVQKITNDADNSFPKIQQREVFYSIQNGYWQEPTTWQTASGRVGLLPTANDDVYIRHVVNYAPNDNRSVRNVYNFGTFNLMQITTLRLLNIKSYGILNITNCTLFIQGNDSFIDSNKCVLTDSTITYNGIDQIILPLNYHSLNLINGNKTIQNDLSINANLGVSLFSDSFFDLKYYNLVINGGTSISSGSIRKYNSEGTLLFVGLVGTSFGGRFDFSGNVNVEFRNGYSYTSSNVINNTGTGTWSFTTNNQTIDLQYTPYIHYNKFEISNGITLSVTSGNGSLFILNDTINGLGATSKLLMKSNATLRFISQNSAQNSMTTGIVDCTTNTGNTIEYNGNYTATISSTFSTFHNLTITGTGTKSLGVNTTINSGLTITSSGIFDCASFNLNVLGTTTLPNLSNATLSKSGTGTITFNGLVTLGQQAPGFDFSGNPNVEFKSGISMYQNTITTGTGQWKFSTNNQTINITAVNISLNCTMLISGAITLSLTQSSGAIISVNNTIDGDNIASSLNIGNTTFRFNNISYYLPMSTFGTFIVTSGEIQYLFNGSISLPYLNYGSMSVGGTGTKTLSGNTTLSSVLSLIQDSGVTFECSTFDLSVGGNTIVRRNTTLSKNGTGNLTFIGILNTSTDSTPAVVNFFGNPNVEFRNGISFVNQGNFTSGTGSYTFSTNNQSIDTNGALTFNGNISIANNIVLNYNCTQGSFASLTLNGILNGGNASSIFRMGTGSGTPLITYRNATQPMATGILDTSTNLNTWIYGNSNQDIKGGPTTLAKQVYRNLTLNGGGTKTLQGYVSVLNTYTLTSPATLANNGFTLTNP